MDKILHHLETMRNHSLFVGMYRGIIRNQVVMGSQGDHRLGSATESAVSPGISSDWCPSAWVLAKR